jgi:hypothetical protein
MGVNTKSFDNASDMITFSRSSGAYGLTKVSYGSELVSNGDFSSDSDWTKGTGWTISGGVASCDGSQSSSSALQSVDILTIGKVYEVTFTIVNISAGVITPRAGTNGAGTARSATGTYIEIITCAGTDDLRMTASNNFIGSIDNVSVKEVLYNSSDPSATLKLIYHPNDVPRIEYNVDGSAKGILVEEARTNLFTNSNSLATATNITATLNNTVSPDGKINGTLLSNQDPGTGTLIYSYYHSNISLIQNTQYTLSCYAKYKAGSGFVWLLCEVSGDAFVMFDILNGVAVNLGTGSQQASSSSIEDAGNGWYRISATFTKTSAGGPLESIGIGVSPTSTQPNWDGTGLADTEQAYVYGFQLEESPFPTSYIKTENATATRALDTPQINVSNFINKSAGTFLATFNYSDPTNVDANYVFGGIANIRIFYNNGGTSDWQSFDGSAATTFGAVDSGEVYKLAVAIKTDSNISTAKNGDIVATSTSGTALMTNIEATPLLSIGGGSASQKLNGHIKSITYYPRRLTDAQIQRLTQPISTPTLSLTFDGQATSFTEDSIHG